MHSETDDVVEEVTDVKTNASDPLVHTVKIGTRRFLYSLSFEDLSPTELKRIVLIPWFDRGAVRAYAEPEFICLILYACDDEFYNGVSTDALAFRLCRRTIAMDYIYLAMFGTIDVKGMRSVAVVYKRLQAFVGGPLIDEYVYVDM